MTWQLFFKGSKIALCGPDGARCDWLSQALSTLVGHVTPRTAKRYAQSVQHLFTQGRLTVPEAARLAVDADDARLVLERALTRAGCILAWNVRPGVVHVTAPPAQVHSLAFALTALHHCYHGGRT